MVDISIFATWEELGQQEEEAIMSTGIDPRDPAIVAPAVNALRELWNRPNDYGNPTRTVPGDHVIVYTVLEAVVAALAATAAEPDVADTVEAAAKAAYMADIEHLRAKSEMWLPWDNVVKLGGGKSIIAERYRKMARASIAAMPAPDDNWLDKTLDSVHRDASVRVWLEAPPEPEVGLPHYFEARLDHDGPFTAKPFYGTGPTRKAAIEDAVRQARPAMQSQHEVVPDPRRIDTGYDLPNGERILEGDVLECDCEGLQLVKWEPLMSTWIVWSMGEFDYCDDDGNEQTFPFDQIAELKEYISWHGKMYTFNRIGNVYDNPDLIGRLGQPAIAALAAIGLTVEDDV